jgi:hypothetical protein
MSGSIKGKNLCVLSFINEIVLFLVYDLALVPPPPADADIGYCNWAMPI